MKKYIILIFITLTIFITGVYVNGAGGGGGSYTFITAIEDLNGAEITFNDAGGINSAMTLYSGESFTLTSSPSNMYKQTSNNTIYTSMSFDCTAGTITYGNTIVFQNQNWVSSSYQTIEFFTNLNFSVSGLSEGDFVDFMNNIIWYYSQNVISYVISFNGNGATGGTTPSSIEKVAGTTYNITSSHGSLYKTNYTFVGWNTDASATTGISSVVVNSNITLYAIWRQNTTQYTISYNGNGALYGTTPAGTTLNAGSTYILPGNTGDLVKPGFNQWDEEWEVGSISSSSGEYITTGNRLVSKNYISVIPNQEYYIRLPQNTNLFTRYYDENKNYISYGVTIPYYDSYILTIPNNVYYLKFQLGDEYGNIYNHDICINISDPAKNGTYEPWKPYYFNGWNTTQNATTGLSSVVVNSNIVFYAVWVDPSATLTFDLQNGALNGAYNTYTLNTTRGTTIDLTQYEPQRVGMVFAGWTLSLTEDPVIITSITITQDTTIYAVWESSNIAYVIIQYNKNGAESGEAPSQVQVLKGTMYYVEDNPGNLSRPGYVFLGWNTYPSANGVINGLNATENTTLYAIWQQRDHEEVEIQLLGRAVANIYIYNGNNPYFYTIFQDLETSFLTLDFEGYNENSPAEVEVITYDSDIVWNIISNKITFTFNGEKLTRVSRVAYNEQNVVVMQGDWDRVNIDEFSGYFGFTNPYNVGGKVIINLAISETNNDVDNMRNIIGQIVGSTQKLMDVKFGWITLGSIIAVVLSIGVVFFVFKIIRGGGNG